ncbi:MAG: hydrogenase expression/formation protein HypE [Chitinivibrionales bacterium]|nr:hydrogenase expression/formation protein HypE [Chitinivibrionales bacterium]
MLSDESSPVKRTYTTPLDIENGCIELTHGSGGLAMAQLIDEMFVAAFDNDLLRQGNDSACFEVPTGYKIVTSVDAHVVSPLFFPGGDIGSLSVHGTINDVATSGAQPLYLTAGFILEEGLPLKALHRVATSMGLAARNAGVPIISGDTKVVEKGKGDGIFIATTGIGIAPRQMDISGSRARPGDAVLINGTLGDHGVTIMSLRNDLHFQTTLRSDSASLHTLVAGIIDVTSDVHVLRDPTRGGIASTLNEIAEQSQVGIKLQETAIPLNPQVKGACELLGLDPLYVANEGKMLVIVPNDSAERVLQAMLNHPLGRQSALIGEVVDDDRCMVTMQTALGGERIVQRIAGEQLPRIC